jgi:coenzyme F420-reducing hydrogenase gamma subunit
MKPRLAVHKFASCDGCQLALLAAGEALLELAARVEFVHFAELGVVNPEARADIAFIEGSVSTPEDAARLAAIRAASDKVVTIGVCATAGGIQALRNLAPDAASWPAAIYARPHYVASLAESMPIASVIKVDLELWGCPVTTRQLMSALHDLIAGVRPALSSEAVCLDCKRAGNPCVLVSRGEPCLGPVTRTGCFALCPALGRACYGCFGPSAPCHADALADRFVELGLTREQAGRRMGFITSASPHPGPPPLAGEKAPELNPPPPAGERALDLNPPPLAGEGRVGAGSA